ncbi:MAG TPA: hypothetical protein VN515_02915 [Terriglobales bacterium]|nr:hypothetical protein [Terriglobales bacterium]
MPPWYCDCPGPYEPVAASAQILVTPSERAAGLNLLNLASQDYTFGQQGRPDTAIEVALQSSGQAAVEGSGAMTEIFANRRTTWSANFANTVSGLQTDAATHPIPLRVVMARNALLWPIGRIPALKQLRVANVTFAGKPLTCVLVTEAAVIAPAAGRGWRESEFCMNSAGLLELMSPAPGLAYVYDYSTPLNYAGHTVASAVTAYIGSSPVLQIHVTRLGPPGAEDLANLNLLRPHAGVLSGPIFVSLHPATGASSYQVDQVAVVHATFDPQGRILDSELLAGDPALLPSALARVSRIRFRPGHIELDVYARVEFAAGQ